MSNTVIGSSRLYFSTLASTNRFATCLLSKTRPRAGTVISADFQTNGEGQYGRSWFGSKGKNLYVSTILYPQLAASEQFRLSAFAALAVRETVSALSGANALIKWPNDIYSGDSKVAGILIRNTISGQKIQNSVIGIGMNVNEEAFPGDLPNPASINRIAGREVGLHEARELLIENLNEFYRASMESSMNVVCRNYETHLYMIGQNARFELTGDNATLGGVIGGVDEFGRLRVTHDNSEHAFALNEIRLMK